MSNTSISGNNNPLIKEFIQLKNKPNLTENDLNKFSNNKNLTKNDVNNLIKEIYKDKIVDDNEKKLISSLVNNSSNKDKLISSIKTGETSINPKNTEISDLFTKGLKNINTTSNNNQITKEIEIEKVTDPEKIKKMKASPFSYFRATNKDFINYANNDSRIKTNIPNIQLQGDAHLENVGAHKKKDGAYGFGFNDFDDSIKGSYKMDLGRLATSIRFMAKEKGLTDEKTNELVDKFLNKYKSDLSKYKSGELDKSKEPSFENNNLISSYLNEVDTDNKSGKFYDKRIKGDLFNYEPDKKGEVKGGFKSIDETKEPNLKKDIINSLNSSDVLTNLSKQLNVDIKDLKITDIARRQAGTASIGSDRFAILVKDTKNNKTIILDMKESGAPSGDPKSTDNSKRIREASKSFIGNDIDSYDFGETKISNKTFCVKEYSSANSNIKTEALDMDSLVDSVAQLFARAHANSGQEDKILEESSQMIKDITNFSKDIYEKLKTDYDKFKESN